jgi:hypothetical protein
MSITLFHIDEEKNENENENNENNVNNETDNNNSNNNSTCNGNIVIDAYIADDSENSTHSLIF